MPFESEAQRGLMWAKHPRIARRWAHEYPGQHDLPYHKGDKKKKGSESPMNKAASSEGMLMTDNFGLQVIDALQASATAIARGEQDLQKQAADVQAYTEKLASTIDTCVRFGIIDDVAAQRDWLKNELATPVGALGIIEKMAAHESGPATTVLGAREVGPDGQSPRHQKHASAESPYVGARSSEKPASWLALERGLGVQ